MRTIETIRLYYGNEARTAVVYYADGKKVKYTKKFPSAVASFIARKMGANEFTTLMRRGWVVL